MSSIRSILEEVTNAYDAGYHLDPRLMTVDQALKDILKDYISKEEVLRLIDGAKPTKSTTAVLPYGDTKFNEAIDQYQSNLKELLK